MDGGDNPKEKAKRRRLQAATATNALASTEKEPAPKNVEGHKILTSECRRNDEAYVKASSGPAYYPPSEDPTESLSDEDFDTATPCSPSQLPSAFSLNWKHAPESSQGQAYAFHAPTQPLSTDLSQESQGYTPSPPRASGGKDMDSAGDIFDRETGAPAIRDILTSYDTHVARWIWMGDPTYEESILNVHRRDKWVKKMINDHTEARGKEWAALVERSLLTSMFKVPLTNVDHTLVTAFVERWHADTNTFHFPWGEMTITLHDVRMICGLPIDGEAVTSGMSEAECRLAMGNAFGWDMAKINTYYTRGGILGKDLRAARDALIADGDRASDVASAYLLELLGSTIFMDKSTNKLHTRLASLVFDHDRTGKLAWGTGALAFLYRALGEASRVDVMTMCGLSALLEHWIWLYFPFFHGHSAPDGSIKDRPVGSQHAPTDRTRLRKPGNLKAYRSMLDQLPHEDVIWFPYQHWGIDWTGELRPSMYRGTIQFLAIQEAYHPDRVLRQFGRVQCVPMTRITPLREVRPRNSMGYLVEYKEDDDRWAMRGDNLCPMILEARLATGSCDMEDGYLDWYLPRGHPYMLKASFEAGPRKCVPTKPLDIARRYQMLMSMIQGICLEDRGATRDEMRQLLAIGTSPDPPLMSHGFQQPRSDDAGSSGAG